MEITEFHHERADDLNLFLEDMQKTYAIGDFDYKAMIVKIQLSINEGYRNGQRDAANGWSRVK